MTNRLSPLALSEPETTEVRWLIKKAREKRFGEVIYYSKEGATEEGNPDVAPRLILTFE